MTTENTTRTAIEAGATAAELLDKMPLATLIQAWEDTSRRLVTLRNPRDINDLNECQHVADARGWMQDAFLRRDAIAFDAWIESTEDSPRGFFNA